MYTLPILVDLETIVLLLAAILLSVIETAESEFGIDVVSKSSFYTINMFLVILVQTQLLIILLAFVAHSGG